MAGADGFAKPTPSPGEKPPKGGSGGGLAIGAAGTAWLVTDNDGVDDSSGETMFWSIGSLD